MSVSACGYSHSRSWIRAGRRSLIHPMLALEAWLRCLLVNNLANTIRHWTADKRGDSFSEPCGMSTLGLSVEDSVGFQSDFLSGFSRTFCRVSVGLCVGFQSDFVSGFSRTLCRVSVGLCVGFQSKGVWVVRLNESGQVAKQRWHRGGVPAGSAERVRSKRRASAILRQHQHLVLRQYPAQ